MKHLDLIRVALRTGRVTRKYPREEPLLTEAFRGSIEIDPERCWGCGACALACPSNALRVEVDRSSVKLHYFLGRCIQCGKCFEVCPREAVSITSRFELAALSAEDLETVIVLDVVKCRVCGRPFGALREFKSVSEVAGSIKNIDMCPDCREALIGEAIAKARKKRLR